MKVIKNDYYLIFLHANKWSSSSNVRWILIYWTCCYFIIKLWSLPWIKIIFGWLQQCLFSQKKSMILTNFISSTASLLNFVILLSSIISTVCSIQFKWKQISITIAIFPYHSDSGLGVSMGSVMKYNYLSNQNFMTGWTLLQ